MSPFLSKGNKAIKINSRQQAQTHPNAKPAITLKTPFQIMKNLHGAQNSSQ
jgi:hypothetical protein